MYRSSEKIVSITATSSAPQSRPCLDSRRKREINQRAEVTSKVHCLSDVRSRHRLGESDGHALPRTIGRTAGRLRPIAVFSACHTRAHRCAVARNAIDDVANPLGQAALPSLPVSRTKYKKPQDALDFPHIAAAQDCPQLRDYPRSGSIAPPLKNG